MKKYYSIILVALLFLTSCEDFLSTESPSALSSETVFETEAMTEAAIMGVYASMTDTYVYGQKLSVNWQGMSDIESNRPFDIDNYNATSRDEGAGNFFDNPYNKTTRWQYLYEMAELATNAIEGIRNSSLLEEKTKKSTMEAYLGEALTLRSLAYFELVRCWGDIPFKATSSNSDLSNVYQGKTDRDSIYASLVSDLQEAVEYLPWLNESSNYSTCERITKGFAKGLLAKVALFAGGWSLRDGSQFELTDVEHNPDIPEVGDYFVGRNNKWKEYYQIAIDQCAEVLGSDDNPHQLDPDYENIWKTVCGLGYNSYNENLFEVAFGEGNNGDIGSLMGYSVSSGSKYSSARGFGGSYVTSQVYYFYSFDPEDTRRDVTLTWVGYTSDNVEDINTNPLDVHFAKWRVYWMSDSYLSLFSTATSRIATGVNWILMRYSDIYLMYAEAMNELNGPDAINETAGLSARQALEAVRERAFGAGSSKITDYDADFFEAVVNERAWEFGCESIRKQDLVRWGLLYDKIETMKETLCLMFDNKEEVTIFDKTYQPDDFPDSIYYKFEDEEYIDKTSFNYYENLTESPGPEYLSEAWFPVNAQKPEEDADADDNYIKWPLRTLVTATGLMESYDYSALLGRMSNGGEINDQLVQYSIGNGECNYRHMFAIYYEDIYESKYYLENSYGY